MTVPATTVGGEMQERAASVPGEFLNNIDAVARRLGCSVRTVRTLIATGDLVATRVARRVLVAESDLLDFMRQHREGES